MGLSSSSGPLQGHEEFQGSQPGVSSGGGQSAAGEAAGGAKDSADESLMSNDLYQVEFQDRKLKTFKGEKGKTPTMFAERYLINYPEKSAYFELSNGFWEAVTRASLSLCSAARFPPAGEAHAGYTLPQWFVRKRHCGIVASSWVAPTECLPVSSPYHRGC